MEETIDIVSGVADRLGTAATFITQVAAEQDASGQAPRGRGGFQALADLYKKISEAKSQGEPLAWINFACVPEIFWAMDITPVFIDNTEGLEAVFPGNPQGVGKYIDIAHAHVPDHVCSANKIFMGAALSGDIAKPDIFVHTSHPCDSSMAIYPTLCASLEIPYFCIDVPYWNDERSFRYMGAELGRLVRFLEEQTGRQLDLDRLREVVRYSNQAHEYILQLNQLKAAVPCPYSSLDSLAEYPLFLGLGGTPELVDYCKRAYEITKAAVDRRQGHLPEEQVRLAWILAAAAFDVSTFTWLEEQYGAISIHCVSHITAEPIQDLSSRDAILMGLARKMVKQPMGREFRGPYSNTVENTIGMCRYYKADAAIFAGHIACKHNWAVAQITKDKIADALGIPTCIFEMDAFDKRVASPEEIKARLEEFFHVNFPGVHGH
jgi:benzoyl-CoA reductase/2-hydroxyglutaryl-CoA dehydratase subunit BcrC/BadD/HgdB